MANFQKVYQFNKDGKKSVKGYRIALQKEKLQQAGFTGDEELEIEYKPKKIIIKVKET